MTVRNHWLDWLKLLAALSMVADHLRFLEITPAWAVIFGRFAMPLFLAIASSNFRKSKTPENFIGRLIPFAFLSELPFFLLTGHLGNVLIFFVLVFGFVRYGNIFCAVGACAFSYSFGGLAAGVLLCSSSSPAVAFIAGTLLNAYPASFLGGALSALTLVKVPCPPLPLLHGRFLLWFYPSHLLALWLVREGIQVFK